MKTSEPIIQYSLVNTINSKRMIGMADEQIAFQLRLPIAQVRAIPYPRPNHSRSRAVQHMQLQVMASKLMPAVEQGDRDAMLTMMKVQKREADLLGLDAPKEVVSHNFNTTLDIEGMTHEQLKEVSTEQLKAMVLREASKGAIDVTPDAAPDATS